MPSRIFLGALAAMALCAAAARGAAAPETIDIPTPDVTLHGTLYRPAGAGPFPAVVALHDCGGLFDRPATTSELYESWAHLLVEHGFVVLFPDSFGARGVDSQCREAERKVHASAQRLGDANAARRWLQAQNFIRPDRISLLGWSNGGTTALWTVRPNARPRNDGPDFRSAVALYPSCRRLRVTEWSARIPTLILIGGLDDWTPAVNCQQMVASARGRSARAQIVVYPGAHHEFDRANVPVRLRTGLVNTVDPSGKAHIGTNPAARADALKRVPEWLER